MRLFRGLSIRAIASATGVSTERVHNALHSGVRNQTPEPGPIDVKSTLSCQTPSAARVGGKASPPGGVFARTNGDELIAAFLGSGVDGELDVFG